MKWKEYTNHIEQILSGEYSEAPYNNDKFKELTNLNNARMKRWLKKGVIIEELENVIRSINTPQQWNFITEPWCGDAAHSSPFIKLVTDLNPLIELKIQLRDDNSEIDKYLTNGAKAMPKLIVRDQDGKDLFTWGPRTKGCSELVLLQKERNLNSDQKKIEQQIWYNRDKGLELQRELLELICANVSLCREIRA